MQAIGQNKYQFTKLSSNSVYCQQTSWDGGYQQTPICNSLKVYLGANIIRLLKDHYSKNIKSLKTETEEGTRKWKDLPCLPVGRINIVKWPFYSNQLTDAVQSQSKSQLNSSYIPPPHHIPYGSTKDPGYPKYSWVKTKQNKKEC